MQITKTLILLVFLPFLISCGGNKTKPEEDAETPKAQVNPQVVAVQPIEITDFKRQLISNGILHTARKAELRFQSSGIIKNIRIKNGNDVKKGYVMAVLENLEQQIALDQAKEQLALSEIELNPQLIGYGGKPGDSTSVNPELYKNLKTQSGYNQAVNNFKRAQLEFNQTFLKAPFTGVIADLNAQSFNSTSPAEVFCVLLDHSSLIAEFQVLETEIDRVFIGQTVKVTPYANDSLILEGSISEINPMVDENGLIKITARIDHSTDEFTVKPIHCSKLFDGMNVKVIVESRIPNQLVVPKEAVVLRSNKAVVFTYEHGLTKWNYVKIAYENSLQYAISEGLKASDSVIVNGNLNLAHDAKVLVH